MNVVIPAGGEGTRLFPYTSIMPKALLPVDGKPVLWWIIRNLRYYGIEEAVLCVNKQHMKGFLHELRDCPIRYFIGSNEKSCGSAGEILCVKDRLCFESFLLHYSDELTPVDLGKLIEAHKNGTGIATLAVIRKVPLDVGVVKIEGENLVEIDEKPMLDRLAWAGIAVFDPEIFQYIRPGDDFARDVFPRVLKDGRSIQVYESDALWLDVGSLSHYKRACDLAAQGLL